MYSINCDAKRIGNERWHEQNIANKAITILFIALASNAESVLFRECLNGWGGAYLRFFDHVLGLRLILWQPIGQC